MTESSASAERMDERSLRRFEDDRESSSSAHWAASPSTRCSRGRVLSSPVEEAGTTVETEVADDSHEWGSEESGDDRSWPSLSSRDVLVGSVGVAKEEEEDGEEEGGGEDGVGELDGERRGEAVHREEDAAEEEEVDRDASRSSAVEKDASSLPSAYDSSFASPSLPVERVRSLFRRGAEEALGLVDAVGSAPDLRRAELVLIWQT